MLTVKSPKPMSAVKHKNYGLVVKICLVTHGHSRPFALSGTNNSGRSDRQVVVVNL